MIKLIVFTDDNNNIHLPPVNIQQPIDQLDSFSKSTSSSAFNKSMKMTIRPMSEMGNRSVTFTFKKSNTKSIPMKTFSGLNQNELTAPNLKSKLDTCRRVDNHAATLKVPHLNKLRSSSAKNPTRNNFAT